MYKLIIIMGMMSIWLAAQLMQVEEELGMKTMYQSKRAVNRAAHAAAQQLDKSALAEGILRIDEGEARALASLYLRSNLMLDEQGAPLPNSPLRHPVEVVALDIVNAEESFPYHYRNETYDFEATLRRPGVVMIVRIAHPRRFAVIDDRVWHIRGTAELVDRTTG